MSRHFFSAKGLSTEVNKATSLRNFIKMALVARGSLKIDDTSQQAIMQIDKHEMIDDIQSLRKNFETSGILLLNTALIFTDKKSSTKHIKAWRPFLAVLLQGLIAQNPKLILFGSHAQALHKHLPLSTFEHIDLMHPYNHTFISSPLALKLFTTMKLLEK